MITTRYGRLTYLNDELGVYYGSPPVLFSRWRLECQCGGQIVAMASSVRSGMTASCGCFRREHSANAKRTHGKTGTAEYRVWQAMKRRCQNANCQDFPEYGSRGIKVCDRWQTFEPFLADMGPRPSTAHSIDRIDSNGDYKPENCRWALIIQQQNNRRSNRFFEHNGARKTIAEWSREMQMDQRLLRYHLVVKGRSIEQVLQQRCRAHGLSVPRSVVETAPALSTLKRQ